MAFFDDLSKKISQAGQTAVQKTKDITDIARINGLISDEEKKLNALYVQIGKLYVEKHSADSEGEFTALVGSVKEAETKVADYRRQIQDIKGMVRCEKCGAAVDANVAFCSSCGNHMPKPAPAPAQAATAFCTSCGAKIADGVRFCTSCGKPVEAPAPAPAPAAEALAEAPAPAPVEQAPAVEQPAAKTCPNCNSVVEQDSAFCTECGTKLN